MRSRAPAAAVRIGSRSSRTRTPSTSTSGSASPGTKSSRRGSGPDAGCVCLSTDAPQGPPGPSSDPGATDPSPTVSGGERALDPLSVAARWFAAVFRERAREGVLGGVADEVGDAPDGLLALAEEPGGELHSPAGEVRGRRFADEVVEAAHERRS